MNKIIKLIHINLHQIKIMIEKINEKQKENCLLNKNWNKINKNI